MTFLLYLVGAIAFISGTAWVATLLGVANFYVTIAAGVLLAIAVIGAATYARAAAPPPA